MISRKSACMVLLLALLAIASSCRGGQGPDSEPGQAQQAVYRPREIFRADYDAVPGGNLSIGTDGRRYFTGEFGPVVCQSADGTELWRYTATDPASLHEVRGNDGHIRLVEMEYFSNPSRSYYYIVAIEGDGNVIWRREIPNETLGTVFLDDIAVSRSGWTAIYAEYRFSSGGGSLFIFNPDGGIAWQQDIADNDHRSQITDLALSADDKFITLDYGGELIKRDWDGSILQSSGLPAEDHEFYFHILDTGIDGVAIMDHHAATDYNQHIEGFRNVPLDDYFVSGVLENGYRIAMYGPELELQWQADTHSRVYEARVLADGALAIGGEAGEVAVFDSSGNESWRYMPDQQREATIVWDERVKQIFPQAPFANVGVVDMLIGKDKSITAATATGLVFRLHADGSEIWSRPGAGKAVFDSRGFGIRPEDYEYTRYRQGLARETDGDILYLQNDLIRLDQGSGDLVDFMPGSDRGTVLLAADGNLRRFAGFECICLDSSGNELWRAELQDRIGGHPVAGKDSSVYIPTVDGSLACIDATGNAVWQLQLPARVECQPQIGLDGNIYALDITGTLQAVSPGGSIIWSLPGMNRNCIYPACGPDGMAIPLEESGLAFVTYNGAISWQFQTEYPISSPAAVDPQGNVYFGNTVGNVDHQWIVQAMALDSRGSDIYRNEHINTSFDTRPLLLNSGKVWFEFSEPKRYTDQPPGESWALLRLLDKAGNALFETSGANHDEYADMPIYLLNDKPIGNDLMLFATLDVVSLLSPDGESIPVAVGDDREIRFDSLIIPDKHGGFYSVNNRQQPATIYHYSR
ncbi:MAG: PQQ-binding-like beta-propeller repeat protein [bacterium]